MKESTLDLSNCTFLEIIVYQNPNIAKFIECHYDMQRNSLFKQLELLITWSDKKKMVENEHKKLLNELNKDVYSPFLPLFDTTYTQSRTFKDAYAICCKLGLFIFDANFDKIKTKWYHFFRRKRLKEICQRLLSDPNVEFDMETCFFIISTVKYYLPIELQRLFENADTIELRFMEFCAHFYFKRQYAIALVTYLQNDGILCDNNEKCEFEIRCELLDNDIIGFKQEIANLKAKVTELELMSKPQDVQPTETDLFWNKPKVDLIRLLIAAFDSKVFKDATGMQPTQDKVMSYFSKFLGVDLTHYEQDLSNGLKGTADSNLKIFDSLRKSMQNRLFKR